MLDDLSAYARYATGLRGFLRRPLSADDCAALFASQRAEREQSFLRLLKHGVYDRASSPYRRLLEHCEIEYPDVVALVSDHGLEGALERLHDAGVYVSLDEVKGRCPLVRPGLDLAVSERDFDNPLPRTHIEGRSGGSRSAGRRVAIDLAHLESGAAQASLLRSAFGAGSMAAWVPAPPAVAGLATFLSSTKAGFRVERWFSQTEVRGPASSPRDVLLTATTVLASRLWGPYAFPWPDYTPPARIDKVLQWLVEKARAGDPGWLCVYSSGAVNVCATAVERGDDIRGSVFLIGGEPYTAEKAAVIEGAGARGLSFYGMTEVGSIGMPCARPEVADDVHVLNHRVALLTRPLPVSGGAVDGLFATGLLESAPKLMLNAEVGDYGTLVERECGCAIGAAGLTTHLHSIRSHEKLTTRGMTFLGEELLRLLDGFLPERFGGTPRDYQLIEEEASDGVPHLTLLVSPRVGDISEEDLIRTMLDELSRIGRAQRMMAEFWRSAGAVRVARRDPELTSGGKVLPLHMPSTNAAVVRPRPAD